MAVLISRLASSFLIFMAVCIPSIAQAECQNKMMEKPTSALELIKNIKCVADSQSLLDADTFSDVFLARVFGAANIYRAADPGTENVQVRSTDFDSVAKSEYLGDVRLAAITFVGDYHVDEGSLKAMVSFSIRRGPTFDEIRNVFGDRLVQVSARDLPPPLHGPRSITDERGNRSYFYDCSAKGTKCRMGLHLGPDGRVDNVSAKVEGN